MRWNLIPETSKTKNKNTEHKTKLKTKTTTKTNFWTSHPREAQYVCGAVERQRKGITNERKLLNEATYLCASLMKSSSEILVSVQLDRMVEGAIESRLSDFATAD